MALNRTWIVFHFGRHWNHLLALKNSVRLLSSLHNHFLPLYTIFCYLRFPLTVLRTYVPITGGRLCGTASDWLQSTEQPQFQVSCKPLLIGRLIGQCAILNIDKEFCQSESWPWRSLQEYLLQSHLGCLIHWDRGNKFHKIQLMQRSNRFL